MKKRKCNVPHRKLSSRKFKIQHKQKMVPVLEPNETKKFVPVKGWSMFDLKTKTEIAFGKFQDIMPHLTTVNKI